MMHCDARPGVQQSLLLYRLKSALSATGDWLVLGYCACISALVQCLHETSVLCGEQLLQADDSFPTPHERPQS